MEQTAKGLLNEVEALKLQLSKVNSSGSESGRAVFNYNLITDILSSEGIEAIRAFLNSKKAERIDVYGGGAVGKVLFDVIVINKIAEVIHVVDASPYSPFDFPGAQRVLTSEFTGASADAIIVTPVYAFEAIKRDLEALNKTNIFSVFDVLNEFRRTNYIGSF